MLPSVCVLSDSTMCDNITNTLKQCIDEGANWIAIREYNMNNKQLYSLCEEIILYSQNNGTLISIWNNPEIAQNLQIGLHMPSRYINQNKNSSLKNNLDFDCPLGISTHNKSEILKANNLAINADYITISPIFDSISKENYSGMDKNKFIDLCTYSALPVFAMGGIDENNISQAFEYGAYGVIICGSTMKNPKILNSITKYI